MRAARDLLPDPGRSIASIANLPSVSLSTLYNHIADLQELRAAPPHYGWWQAVSGPRNIPEVPINARRKSTRGSTRPYG